MDKKEVPVNSRKKMAAILADSFMEVTVGEVKHKIRPLRTYSKYKILEVVQSIIHTESDVVSILEESCGNIECAARIVAICLCNHKFTPDYDKNDEMIEEETKNVMLNSTSEDQWADVVIKAFESLSIQTVFRITALSDLMTKSLVGRKAMMNQENQVEQS